MPLVSTLELPGSPVEQASGEARTRYWNPINLFAAGSTISAPTMHVYSYDPANPAATSEVTATVLSPISPFLGSGAFAGMVGFTLLAGKLTPGLEYRCVVSCAGSDGNSGEAFLRVRVLL